MITNPKAKRVLLYGDSFVYGKAAGRNERLDAKTRFSGVLQDLFGANYEVIEEGLRARMLEGENSFFKDRDGLAQFSPVLGSHLPLDVVIIFLGTNDCNSGARKTPEEIAAGLKKYIQIVKQWCEFFDISEPRIVIVAPPEIKEEYYDETMHKIFGTGAGQRSQALPPLYKRTAKELGVEFLDSSKVCEAAEGDGIHLDADNNNKLAQALHTIITS